MRDDIVDTFRALSDKREREDLVLRDELKALRVKVEKLCKLLRESDEWLEKALGDWTPRGLLEHRRRVAVVLASNKK